MKGTGRMEAAEFEAFSSILCDGFFSLILPRWLLLIVVGCGTITTSNPTSRFSQAAEGDYFTPGANAKLQRVSPIKRTVTFSNASNRTDLRVNFWQDLPVVTVDPDADPIPTTRVSLKSAFEDSSVAFVPASTNSQTNTFSLQLVTNSFPPRVVDARSVASRRMECVAAGFPSPLIGLSNPDESVPLTSVDPSCLSEPCDARLSFWNDFRSSPIWLSEDLASLVTLENAVFLSAAAGGAVLLRNNVDGQVQADVAQHGGYWGGASQWLNSAGESVVHVPLLAGLYGYSLYTQDAELHELALTFVASYKFTAISTLVLQYATDTRHGQYGGLNMLKDNGFPSMPASTSFALAAVVDEKYGWKAAIPAYLGAGLIGWAGIDQQQHRVSDVVFGAALGYAIGKSIGSLHYRPHATFKLIPFVDTNSGSQGLQFEKQF